jgi:hypothetical protein
MSDNDFQKKNIERLRDKLDELLKEHKEIGLAGTGASFEVQGVKDWLKENRRIVELTELIPQAKRAEGELQYITKGQYRKYWKREPSHNILTKDGKRVRWEYALDELAKDLGLEEQYGSQADEALKDLIETAVEYKHKLRSSKVDVAVAEEEYQKSKELIDAVTINIGRREQVLDTTEDRSKRAIMMDKSKQAKHILKFPDVKPWLNRPHRYDIAGVDTPKHKKHKKRSIIKRIFDRSPSISRIK